MSVKASIIVFFFAVSTALALPQPGPGSMRYATDAFPGFDSESEILSLSKKEPRLFSWFFSPEKQEVAKFAVSKPMKDMKKRNDLRPLTKAEMEVMNVLWDATEALTIHEIIERYPEPRPAYTTIATFLKIIEAKGYVEHFKKEGSKRCFVFSPIFTREKYIANVMDDVKDSLFGNSTKKLFSFLIRTEDITDEELMEIMQMVRMSPMEGMDTLSDDL